MFRFYILDKNTYICGFNLSVFKDLVRLMGVLVAGFRLFCMCWLLCCVPVHIVMGQLTAHNTDGHALTGYTNARDVHDTVFVFNQNNGTKKGNLSLQYRPPSTVEWTWKKPNTTEFVPYKTFTGTAQCSIDTLHAGEYRILVSNPVGNETYTCRVEAVSLPDGLYAVTVQSDNYPADSYVNSVPRGRYTITVDAVKSEFNWYRFDYQTENFNPQAFATISGMGTLADTLSQGGYKVTVTPEGMSAPCDSFVTWLYMNRGFDFKLRKNDVGAVLYAYKFCDHTDFLLDTNVPAVQSSFVYYNPATSVKWILENTITFRVRAGNGAESETTLRSQGVQYFRGYDPPYQDTRYYFRGNDMFGIELRDDILYETIVPHAAATAVLPEIDPESAPVHVRFVDQSLNATEYFWRFGDGDSTVYNLEYLPPDTVKHTYYIASRTYTAVLFVTSREQCRDSVSLKIKVAPPALDVANVFTPNGDNMNDYFKPYNVSIKQFEISIYTRAGKQVYRYSGNDLRNWEGWDGRIQNNAKEAAEGVYFYVLKAADWNDPTKTYSSGGSIHLYR